MNSELRQIKASAGSGKTFILTRQFLHLLRQAAPETEGFVCKRGVPSGHCWPEILAATFTNKAAAEMKERVVSALKRTALQCDGGQSADWPKEQAREMLERILRRYQRLNIRTIDSLLNMLLRMFALDAGIPPDFELAFEDEELFASVLERFQAACTEENSPERLLLEHALDILLREEQSEGFWVADKIRKRLREIMLHLRQSGNSLCTNQDELSELLRPAHKSMIQATVALEKRLVDKGIQSDKRFLTFLGKCRDTAFRQAAPHTSAYAAKEDLTPCVVKASRPLLEPEDDILYARFKETLARYGREQAIVSGAIHLAPCVLLAWQLSEKLSDIERERGQILGQGLSRLVRDQLEQGGGAPDAFCRLGGRLHHLLIDEFQDTSRDQWAAVTPLAEECLSKGGSLFYVGDVKQAIYGWRGGDAELFDEIRTRPELDSVAAKNHTDQLPHNWRSSERVVAFNNFFFTRLADPDLNADLASQCLSNKATADQTAELARTLSTEFQDAHQSMPPEQKAAPKPGGFVRIERLPGSDDRTEMEQEALDAMARYLLENVRPRRPWSDMAILVRSHDHAALVCDRLVSAGVPVITENSLQLDRHPVVRELAALLRFLEHPHDDLALAELLLGGNLLAPPPGLSPEPGTTAMHDWLSGLERGPGRLPLWKAVQRDHSALWEYAFRPFANKSGLLTPYDLIAEMLTFFQISERHPGAELYVRRFQEVAHRAAEQGMGSLATFLDFWEKKSGEEKVPLPENVDAVRIMTIHKSKGLEFPVVFTPFLFWPWPTSPELIEVELRGRRVLTRLKSDLTEEYQAKTRRGVLEDLHLLYVTWTRAREELYAWFPQKRPRQKSPATKAIDLVLDLPDTEHVFSYGEAPLPTDQTAPSEAAAMDECTPGVPARHVDPPHDQPPSWQARLRVYRHMEQEVADLTARLRGDVAHKAMECIRLSQNTLDAPTPDAIRLAAEQATQNAMLHFPILATIDEGEREELRTQVTDMTFWALDHHELRSALALGRHEPDMVGIGDTPDSPDLKRPDLVYFGPSKTVILEFKTGGRDAAHAPQLGAYQAMLEQWDPATPIRALLVYLDLHAVDAVPGSTKSREAH